MVKKECAWEAWEESYLKIDHDLAKKLSNNLYNNCSKIARNLLVTIYIQFLSCLCLKLFFKIFLNKICILLACVYAHYVSNVHEGQEDIRS